MINDGTFNNDAIEKFIKQVQVAKDYNSKEIRVVTTDAENLAMAIALLLNSNISMAKKIMELQDKVIQNLSSPQNPTNVSMNGGTF
jgi:dihydroorotate dehydrogenase